jgi:hypothetical protein
VFILIQTNDENINMAIVFTIILLSTSLLTLSLADISYQKIFIVDPSYVAPPPPPPPIVPDPDPTPDTGTSTNAQPGTNTETAPAEEPVTVPFTTLQSALNAITTSTLIILKGNVTLDSSFTVNIPMQIISSEGFLFSVTVAGEANIAVQNTFKIQKVNFYIGNSSTALLRCNQQLKDFIIRVSHNL